DACDDAFDVRLDLSSPLRQRERSGGVTGRGEQARGDIRGGGQKHVAVVDPLDTIELRKRPTQVCRARRQAGDAQFIAEPHTMPLGDDRWNLQWHAGAVGRLLVECSLRTVERADE